MYSLCGCNHRIARLFSAGVRQFGVDRSAHSNARWKAQVLETLVLPVNLTHRNWKIREKNYFWLSSSTQTVFFLIHSQIVKIQMKNFVKPIAWYLPWLQLHRLAILAAAWLPWWCFRGRRHHSWPRRVPWPLSERFDCLHQQCCWPCR